MARHFWEGQPDPEADLFETQTYLRPLDPDDFSREVFESLAPADPPTPTELEAPATLLDEHNLSPQEFAERALEHPEMWDELDHQFLQDILEGADANEDLERLADDYLSGRGDERARLAGGPPGGEMPPEFEEDLGGPDEGFDDHIEELENESIPIATLPIDDEPMDLSKIDEWWKK